MAKYFVFWDDATKEIGVALDPTVKLSFTEIADQSLAAYASITPTVNGIFTMVADEQYINCEIYSDAAAAWLPMHKDFGGTDYTNQYNWSGVIGEANKIRFRNLMSLSCNIVVNKIG